MDTMAQNEDAESMEVKLKRSLLARSKRAVITKGPDGDTEYSCVECNFKVHEKFRMEQHLTVHSREYRFLCGICGTALKRKEHLDRHTMEHQEVRPHVCPECGKAFKRKEHLNIHRTIHSGEKSHICPLCDRSFYRKDHLQKHIQTHNKLFMEHTIFPTSDHELVDVKEERIDIKQEIDDEGPVISDMVGGIYDPEVLMEIRAAFDRVNSRSPPCAREVDPERPYACLQCDKTYKRKDHLKLHQVSHMAKDKVCGTCDKAFRTDQQIRSHMQLHHASHTQPEFMECDVNSGTSMEEDLEAKPDPLLSPRSAAAGRPHECPVCRRRFKRKQHLKVHANVHAKHAAPSIWCSLCSEGFFDSRQFESHECVGEGGSPPAVHSANQENDCPTSDMVQVLNEPIIQESSTPIPVPRRVFVCRYCAKPFKRKDHYRIHLHVHTGVKSFFCTDCGKGFYRKDHLQKHSQVHVKVKPKMVEMMRRVKKELPELFPIHLLPRQPAAPPPPRPEITITAPANAKLRVPLQMKVPYQVVTATESGETRVTVHPPDLLA